MAKSVISILMFVTSLIAISGADDLMVPTDGLECEVYVGNLYCRRPRESRDMLKDIKAHIPQGRFKDWFTYVNVPRPSVIEEFNSLTFMKNPPPYYSEYWIEEQLTEKEQAIILDYVNTERQKAMLGVYYNNDDPFEFGSIPPLRDQTVSITWDDKIARTMTAYHQHLDVNKHEDRRNIYPYPYMGENIYSYSFTISDRDEDSVVYKYPVDKLIHEALSAWFRWERPFYKHFNLFNPEETDKVVTDVIKTTIQNDKSLSDNIRNERLKRVKSGHLASMLAQNVVRMGCAAATIRDKAYHKDHKPDINPEDVDVKLYVITCRFGGGMPLSGPDRTLYNVDENFLEQRGLSVDSFAPLTGSEYDRWVKEKKAKAKGELDKLFQEMNQWQRDIQEKELQEGGWSAVLAEEGVSLSYK